MQDVNSNSSLETTSPPPPQSSRSVPARPPTTRPRLATSAGHNAGSAGQEDTSGDEADNDENDDDDDDDEDNDEEPEFFAPSYARHVHQTGRKISPLQHENELFVGSDDDDDDIYEAVNNISDSDDGVHDESEEQIEAFDEQDILHEFLDDIDGLSAVGFGGDLDHLEALTAFSDQSSSSTDAIGPRRVRFTSDVEQRTILLSGSVSPLLTRALLPSALPEDAGEVGNNRMSQSSMVGAGRDPWGFQSSASPQQHGAYYEDSDCMLLMLVIDLLLTIAQLMPLTRICQQKHTPPQVPFIIALWRRLLKPRLRQHHHARSLLRVVEVHAWEPSR